MRAWQWNAMCERIVKCALCPATYASTSSSNCNSSSLDLRFPLSYHLGKFAHPLKVFLHVSSLISSTASLDSLWMHVIHKYDHNLNHCVNFHEMLHFYDWQHANSTYTGCSDNSTTTQRVPRPRLGLPSPSSSVGRVGQHHLENPNFRVRAFVFVDSAFCIIYPPDD